MKHLISLGGPGQLWDNPTFLVIQAKRRSLGMEEDRKKELSGLSISKTVQIEWGNQIRSYVLHPYKQVKDHRTGVELRDVEKVLEDGKLEEFIEAEKDI